MIGNRRAWLAGASSMLMLCLAGRYATAQSDRVVKVQVKKFEFTPNPIALKKGEPVVLEFTTEDVLMGFNAPDFGVRADIVPGKGAQVRLVPQQTGTFDFHCDIFCGDGHEEMSGQIVVS
jgi:cytochrome c oxidase subunit 2